MISAYALLIDIARLCLWLAILAAIFVPLERLFSLRRPPARRGNLVPNLGFYFLSSLLPAFLLSLPMATVIAVAHRIFPAAYFGWVESQAFWAKLVASFVIGEIGFYWGHRLSHEWRWLWRFHAVHHRPDHLHWLINTRAHPVDIVFGRLCGLAPIYLIGLAGRGAGEGNLPAILFAIGGTIWGFLIHANINWAPRWLEPVLSSPRFHHWHHVTGGAGPIDRNFASMLPVVDRLFGTLHLPAGNAWPTEYGVEERANTVAAQPLPA